MTLPKINVICIKWGTAYTANDVNRLYNHIIKNTDRFQIKFHCFTEISDEIDDNIIIHPLPGLKISDRKIAEEINKFAYQKEAGLCDDNLGNLNGERVFFFDLDVVITGNLDDLFSYPKSKDFVIINDWNSIGNKVGNASFYSWVVGTLGYVKADFEKSPIYWKNKFQTASQEYLSYKIIEKFNIIRFWPEKWVSSFKFNCLPAWYLRYFVTPQMPVETKILVFHGSPKVDEALAGKWVSGNKKTRLWHKLYKKIRPCTWLNQYIN